MSTATSYAPLVQNGVTTLFLPITSAWPAVSECITDFYRFDGQFAPKAFDPFYGISIDTEITCLPPAVTSWTYQTPQTPLQTVTSIGPLVCPQLYYTVTTSAVDASSTFIACCPSNYGLDTLVTGITQLDSQCTSTVPVGQVFTFMTYFKENGSMTPVTTTIASTPLTNEAMAVNGYLFADVSNIDAGTTTTSANQPSSGVLPTSTSPTATSTASASSTATSAAGTSSGLSPGAKAGIGIGVAAVVVIIGGLVTALAVFIRRSKRDAAQQAGAGGDEFGRESSAYYKGGQQDVTQAPKKTDLYVYGHEIGTSQPAPQHEMGLSRREEVHEMPGAVG